eukprot:Skav231239  [mRNA]  locus=scaffold1540:134775:136022:+ [translate_table: standard]
MWGTVAAWLCLTCLLPAETKDLFGTLDVNDAPKARTASSLVLYKNRLWTFGGISSVRSSKPEDVLGDLNCFDIESNTWIKVVASGAPEAHFGHSAVVDFAGTMWLWGGILWRSGMNETYSLNLNEIDLYPKDGKTSGAWAKVEVKGTTPAVRLLHSGVTNGTGMVIFGGQGNGPQAFYGDAHFLDFQTATWSEIKGQGDAPPARASHGAAMSSLGEMWVYGGHGKGFVVFEDLYYLKLETNTWVKVAAKGVSPGPLIDHFQVMDAAGQMWLAGGRSGTGLNDKVFYMDAAMLGNAEWKEVEEFRGAVQRIGAKAAIETSGRMWCYGGAEQKEGQSVALGTITWLETNEPTPSTATTSAHPLDPNAQSGGVGVGTVLLILFVVAAIVAGALFLRRRRERRLLETGTPREIELGPRA